ncbi:tetratricopeptide repeat protein [Vibrio splendidus]
MNKYILLALVVTPWTQAETSINSFKTSFDHRDQHIQLTNESIALRGGIPNLINDAKEGDAIANYTVYNMYKYGIAFEKNSDKAISYLTAAAEESLPKAQFEYSQILMGKSSEFTASTLPKSVSFQSRYNQGLDLVRQSATAGHPYAQYELGMHFLNGHVLPEDRDLAAYWFSNASAQGLEIAKKAQQKHFKQLRKIESYDEIQSKAVLGDLDAIIVLGTFYENGWKVERDIDKAKRLYQVAANQGHQLGISKLNAIINQ